MIEIDKLKEYAKKLMFDMTDEEYITLQKEFEVISKQMELIDNYPNIRNIIPMTYPFELDNVELRNDDEIDIISSREVLSNAPLVELDEVKVPKVVN